jgi:thiosulfate dehydrogenase [quinone] large subunit
MEQTNKTKGGMIMESDKTRYIWAALRIGMGWLFLWSFLDKLFGLGFATKPEAGWLAGGSPTAGFLANATSGPLAGLYQSMAGNPVVDWLFMLGLAGLGVALILGIGVQIAGYAGALFVLLLWSSRLPPANNPIMDEHIIYAFVLVGLAMVRAGQRVGLGRWWYKLVAKNLPWLQ